MNLNEVSPPGWGHTKAEKEKTKPWKPKSKIGGTAAAFKRALDDGRFKGLPGSTTKKEKTADMFKLMWSMKKKGDKPHYKPGTDKKYKKYQEESLSVKDSKKLKKASVLDQSKDPKDWDSARARRTEIDYKDLMRQIKAKKKMRKESVENGKVDLTLKAGVNNVLKQDNKEYDRGLLAQVNKDGSYDVAYWYDKYKAYPVEVEIDGKTCAKDAKKIHIKFHPELKKEEVSRRRKPSAIRKKKTLEKLLIDKEVSKIQKEEASYKQRDKALKKSKKAMDYRHRTIHKGGDDDVNEATTMRDNNLFGNAYAGSYETLKKKIGSKKKHNKPAFKEGISFKDFRIESSAAWQRKEGKNKEGGLNEKGRKSYERENPGSDLKAPQPEGGSRKKSFCARMGGMKKKLTSQKTANDPDSRINKALRKWKC